jgi:hypothetical protein
MEVGYVLYVKQDQYEPKVNSADKLLQTVYTLIRERSWCKQREGTIATPTTPPEEDRRASVNLVRTYSNYIFFVHWSGNYTDHCIKFALSLSIEQLDCWISRRKIKAVKKYMMLGGSLGLHGSE